MISKESLVFDCHFKSLSITFFTSIPKSNAIEHVRPLLETSIGFPYTQAPIIHGSGKPTVTSKMFEPTELDSAMSPNPFFATITLVSRSGIDVPAASRVSPMIAMEKGWYMYIVENGQIEGEASLRKFHQPFSINVPSLA